MRGMEHANLILYPISPTIAFPSTFPMLEVNPTVWNEDTFGEYSRNCIICVLLLLGVLCEFIKIMLCLLQPACSSLGEQPSEENRKFTRGAVNPLLCRMGWEHNRKDQDPRLLAVRDEAEEERLRNEELEEEDEEEEQEVVTGMEAVVVAARNGSLQAGEAADDAEDESVAVQLSSNNYDEKEFMPDMPLVSGLYSSRVERLLADSLDNLCPSLTSTPLLQEKALRVVFSQGVEVMIIDAEHSAMLGKLKLAYDELLTPEETLGVIENFQIPVPDDRSLDVIYL